KDVRLPVQLQRAMAAEAEAAREARAKVIAAEGEQKASRALREASEVIGDSPAALQLRYLQDVRLPVQLQRAMAAEAEAAREARAKVIAAEGEQKASRALREASEVIGDSPAALQLRYLQTLNTISAEKNSTIVFPLPIDLLTYFMKAKEES
ncbi:jg13961, partial [Pararge aegeria aegeria]